MAKDEDTLTSLSGIRGLLAQLLEEQVGVSLNKVSERVDMELIRVAESLRDTEIRLAEVAEALSGLNRYVTEDHKDLKGHTEQLTEHTVQIGRIKVYGLVAFTVITVLSNIFGPLIRDRFRDPHFSTSVQTTRIGP